jgi:hypothetical protein
VLDQGTVAEDGPGAEKGDQVRVVDGTPAILTLPAIVARAAVRDYGEHRVVPPDRRRTADLA